MSKDEKAQLEKAQVCNDRRQNKSKNTAFFKCHVCVCGFETPAILACESASCSRKRAHRRKDSSGYHKSHLYRERTVARGCDGGCARDAGLQSLWVYEWVRVVSFFCTGVLVQLFCNACVFYGGIFSCNRCVRRKAGNAPARFTPSFVCAPLHMDVMWYVSCREIPWTLCRYSKENEVVYGVITHIFSCLAHILNASTYVCTRNKTVVMRLCDLFFCMCCT